MDDSRPLPSARDIPEKDNPGKTGAPLPALPRWRVPWLGLPARRDRAPALLLLFLIGAYLVLAFHPIWDIDVFWHIRAGEWIVDHLALPTTDIFSAVDPRREWHTFQWAYEVLVHALDQAGGLVLIRAVHALVAVTGLSLLCVFVWRRSTPWHGLLVFAISAFLFADRLRVRPDVFNLLFLAMLLPGITSCALTIRGAAFIGAISALWANVHAGGALLAPILIGSRLAGSAAVGLLEHRRINRKLLGSLRFDALLFAATLALMALMPSFLRGAWQAFSMLGPSREFIPEWIGSFEFLTDHASTVHEIASVCLPLAGFVGLIGLAFTHWHRKASATPQLIAEISVSLPLIYLAMKHVRFLWLGAVPLAFLAMKIGVRCSAGPPGLEPQASVDLPSGMPRHRASRWPAVLLGAALLVVASDVYYHVWQRDRGPAAVLEKLGTDLEPGVFPEQAARFLARARVRGRILNHGAWGGFLLYELWPDCTVWTDGRGNFTQTEADVLKGMESLGKSRFAIDRAFERSPFEIIVAPDPFPLLDWDRRHWILVHRDTSSRIFFRNSVANAPNFEGVRAVYRDEGLDLESPRSMAEVFEMEDRINRFLGLRIARESTTAARVGRLTRELHRSAGNARSQATFQLATLYFGIGLYPEARAALQVVEYGPRRDIQASSLVAFAHFAQGGFGAARRTAFAAMDEAQRRIARGEEVPSRTMALLQHILSHAPSPPAYRHEARP